MFDPNEDGVSHINVYFYGKTRIGRLLSNMSNHPTYHKVYGHFAGCEGAWYYLCTGMKDDKLKVLSGFEAKKYGKKLKRIYNPNMRDEMWEMVKWKIDNTPEILNGFIESDLPFVHYYHYNGKVIVPKNSDWLMEELNYYREELING